MANKKGDGHVSPSTKPNTGSRASDSKRVSSTKKSLDSLVGEVVAILDDGIEYRQS
jgi:hypothetical protein